MSIDPELEKQYRAAEKERDDHTKAILDHPAQKKIVVAGPGTGKTHLFSQLVSGRNNTLTLTFINALVEDLSLGLAGLSTVRTLHAFARRELARLTKKEAKMFPALSQIIAEDADIILGNSADFDSMFRNRDDSNPLIPFYKRRKNYYEYYGMTDVVYAVVRYWEERPDKVPEYDQIVVDEFQDFNKLEVSLIDLLATKSPVVLAGDDDQALYKFKDADPKHIRYKHGPSDPSYEPFCLPLCQRCTRVIVEAANDIIQTAISRGLLAGRIPKRFDYFASMKSDQKSTGNPRLEYLQAHSGQMAWTISQQIAAITLQERQPFTVLVIAPFRKQLEIIVKALKKKGFKNIAPMAKTSEMEPTLMDGLLLLLEDAEDNLGWRIACKTLGDSTAHMASVKTSDADPSKKFCDLVPTNLKKEVKRYLTAMRAVRDDKKANATVVDEILAKSGGTPAALASAALLADITDGPQMSGDAATRAIPITATTVQSSKGLAADYVFITHFEDRYFIESDNKKEVTDHDVCGFLVAMTRARKRVFLIGPRSEKDPTFLSWIKTERVQRA